MHGAQCVMKEDRTERGDYENKTYIIYKEAERCKVEALDSKFKGMKLQGVNMLRGSLESDKIYAVGDKALVVISVDKEGNPTKVTMSDYYRLDKEAVLAAVFILFLVLIAGANGFRAIFSFVISVLAIWKVLVPLYLKRCNPMLVGLLVTTFLTVMIIYFVYGIDLKSLSAISGSLLGTLTTCVTGVIFTNVFKIHGAVMDLAVDITSAVNEVVEKKPDIGWKEAFISGMNVGRAAMGTMTTTLLPAYSGRYMALLMVFMAQGTPISHILNFKYVSAEILHTIVGSFGLVTVAPFTALTGSILLTKK